jgi:hypothetical protein
LTNIDAINDAEFAGPIIKKEELQEIENITNNDTNNINIFDDKFDDSIENIKPKKEHKKKVTIKKYKKTIVSNL